MRGDEESTSRSSRLRRAGEQADAKSRYDVTRIPRSCPLENDGWVEVELVGREAAPIRDAACVVVDADGREHRTRTDAKGGLRVEGIPHGECRVSFVELDRDAWGPEPEGG